MVLPDKNGPCKLFRTPLGKRVLTIDPIAYLSMHRMTMYLICTVTNKLLCPYSFIGGGIQDVSAILPLCGAAGVWNLSRELYLSSGMPLPASRCPTPRAPARRDGTAHRLWEGGNNR